MYVLHLYISSTLFRVGEIVKGLTASKIAESEHYIHPLFMPLHLKNEIIIVILHRRRDTT